MTQPDIQTPKGVIHIGPNGKAELVWNTNFKPRWTREFSKVQIFIDSEVLRYCEPYVPLKTGMLIMSGILGTQIGSGIVKYIAPYAKHQYYLSRKPGSQTGPLRGPFWFTRAMAVHKPKILEGSKAIFRTDTL
jgi:hypothetical protein